MNAVNPTTYWCKRHVTIHQLNIIHSHEFVNMVNWIAGYYSGVDNNGGEHPIMERDKTLLSWGSSSCDL